MKGFIPKVALALVVLTVLGLGAGGAVAENLVITDKNNGQAFTVQVGQKITVNLRHPGSGGYNFLKPEYDHTILKLVGESVIPRSKPRRMGDFGRMVYEFQGLKEGKTALVIPIKRPWEKESQAFLNVTILVRP